MTAKREARSQNTSISSRYAGHHQGQSSGTTPREVLAKFKTMQMVDVRIPTTDERELVLSRYTQPEAEHRVLLERLRLKLPEQPPPKITARQVRSTAPQPAPV